MPKVHDPIPSRSFSVAIVGDDLDTLTEIVNESRRLKPEWHDTPQTILISIIQDFLDQADAFDQFVLTRVDTEQRSLLRKIEELKGLKRAVRDGTLEEPDATPGNFKPTPPPAAKELVTASPSIATPPPLGSVSPAVR
jgi:hypothetical protein